MVDGVFSFSFVFIQIYLAHGPAFTGFKAMSSRDRMALLPHFPNDIVRMLTVMVLLPSRTFCNFLRSLPGLLLSVTLLSFFLKLFYLNRMSFKAQRVCGASVVRGIHLQYFPQGFFVCFFVVVFFGGVFRIACLVFNCIVAYRSPLVRGLRESK